MKPWLKLYREERGSFACLPLMARGLFSELLKLADEDGVIDCGALPPADYIFRRLGADKSDRRMVRKYLPMLVADGCIEEHELGFSFPGWDRYQAPGSKPKRARTGNEPVTNGQRTDQKRPVREPIETESATKGPRSGHEDSGTPRNDSTPETQIRVEKSRKEESRRREDARDPANRAAAYAFFEQRVKQATGRHPPGTPDPRRLRDTELLLERGDFEAEVHGFCEWLKARKGRKEPDVRHVWKCFREDFGTWSNRVESDRKRKSKRDHEERSGRRVLDDEREPITDWKRLKQREAHS